MITTYYQPPAGEYQSGLSMDQLASVLPLAGGLLWVDLLDEPLESCRRLLLETFGFHPLAVDDALEEQHVPRVDDWGNYLYLVLHTVLLAQQETTEIDTLELDIFLGHNYLVTYHTQPIDVISRVQRACQRDDRHLRRGAGHLLYKLIDELVADYMPVVDQIDEVIDRVEDQIFDDTGTVLLEEVFTLKRGLLHLRRIIAPQREVLNKLARGDFAVIRPEDRVFFRDIYDHLVRLYDITEGLRDLVGGALDTYLSVVNNRMNDVMKTLTIITTLFMPVSFLAGFFGINFFQAVEPLAAWTSRPAFIAMLAAMTVTPLVMYLWMRRRRLV